MKELQVLAHVGNNPSKKAKEAILKEYDSPSLRKILLYTYDPYLTYRVRKLDFPDRYNSIQPDISEELFMLLDLLAAHKATPTEARAMLKRLLAKCTDEGATWVAKILSRDLKIGISSSTINKAFPKLVPVFDVMLAQPMIEPKSGETNWHRIRYPAICEIKKDGMRVIAICNGETVNFYSREGLELLTLDHLIPQILSLKPGAKFVLDGESVGVVFNPNCKTAKKHHDAGKNWQFAQGLSMTKTKAGTYSDKEMNDCLGYEVWDIVDYDYFTTQGEKGTCKPLKYRKTELAGLFERLEKPLRSIRKADNVVVNNKEEAVDFFKAAVAAGEEGSMIKDIEAPYEFKRSHFMFKIKEFYTADLRVVDCIEGTKGTKLEGSLGTMIVTDGIVTGKVMGGWDEDEGLLMWLRHKKGKMAGSIVEIIYKELTTDNNMRHCVFVRERPDKTETSWG